MAKVDKSLQDLLATLPNDGRRTVVLKMVKLTMVREAETIAKQKELEAKAAPAAQWLNSLKRVRKADTDKK